MKIVLKVKHINLSIYGGEIQTIVRNLKKCDIRTLMTIN